MSKADAQRAFREAKYARQNAPNGNADVTRGAKSTKPVSAPAAAAKPASAKKSPAKSEGALCGHRNMGNKTCSRPAGHPEKNHRYK